MERRKGIAAACLLAAFVLWTLAVCTVDVQAAGPMESVVGFAALNRFVHELTGVHMALYTITDWLSLIPIGVMMGFALLGMMQWIRRKSICRVDRSILALGAFYLVVLAAYIFFEVVAVNERPVLINGVLEASYPSSTTMLVLCVMPTAMMQMNQRLRSSRRRRWINAGIALFTAFMLMGRLVSGVHWFTDIVGGILLSAGLVMLYGMVSRPV